VSVQSTDDANVPLGVATTLSTRMRINLLAVTGARTTRGLTASLVMIVVLLSVHIGGRHRP